VLKFIVKRHLGRYLLHEIDVAELDVCLRQGRVVLRNLLLDCAALNRDLVGGGCGEGKCLGKARRGSREGEGLGLPPCSWQLACRRMRANVAA